MKMAELTNTRERIVATVDRKGKETTGLEQVGKPEIGFKKVIG